MSTSFAFPIFVHYNKYLTMFNIKYVGLVHSNLICTVVQHSKNDCSINEISMEIASVSKIHKKELANFSFITNT